MGFLAPWMLAGLAVGPPLLLLLYLLRRRGREVAVPALFLWVAAAAPAAGPRVAPRRLPPVFWLELAALALLVLGAAGPWMAAPGTRPLLVALDPSYSMTAGGARSPRRLAVEALLAALAAAPDVRATLIVASDPPAVLGEDLDADAVARAVEGWRAEAAAADVDAVLRLAAERRAPAVLVLTDGPAPAELPSRVAWWAFGAARSNLAIVAADRRAAIAGTDPAAGRRDLVTLEVANLGRRAAEASLTVDLAGTPVVSRRRLDGGASWRLRLPVPPNVTVRARLPADELPLDGEVTLPPLGHTALAVRVDGLPAGLAASVREAVAASGAAELAGPDSEAAVEVMLGAGGGEQSSRAAATTDARAGEPAIRPWRVRFHREQNAIAYLGPFAVNRRHPLAAGVTAEGMVWAAGGAAANPPGVPVVIAGPVVLLADEERPDGSHDLHLRLREDLSTLPRTPAWPVLWWNLLAWRRAELPGPERALERLGDVATVRFPVGVETARVSGAGFERQLQALERAAAGGVARWSPPRPGEYLVEAGDQRYAVAVATLQRVESDLRDRTSARRGDIVQALPPRGRREVAWAAALLALLLLGVEGALLARSRGRTEVRAT